jgi:hypothetical protein
MAQASTLQSRGSDPKSADEIRELMSGNITSVWCVSPHHSGNPADDGEVIVNFQYSRATDHRTANRLRPGE